MYTVTLLPPQIRAALANWAKSLGECLGKKTLLFDHVILHSFPGTIPVAVEMEQHTSNPTKEKGVSQPLHPLPRKSAFPIYSVFAEMTGFACYLVTWKVLVGCLG